jgi:REP element-mobilizing transposase RayT
MNPKHRQKIRLDPEMYRTPNLPCFVTIATKRKQAMFSHQDLAENLLLLLRTACEEHNIPPYAYCIMPDHVHLLLSASQTKGIIKFVREIKSRSARMAWQHGYGGSIWQRSFYDHFLRQDEDCRTVANYIIHNPVRNGIVENWGDYPFSGSLVYEL